MLASWHQKITNADSAGVSVGQAVAKPLSNHAKVRTRAAVAAAFGLYGHHASLLAHDFPALERVFHSTTRLTDTFLDERAARTQPRYACHWTRGEVPLATGREDVVAAAMARLRASHADRERVIGVLKAAFVEGRLTKDEFDARAAQAFNARTYAQLAAVTTDIPAGLCGVQSLRKPARAQAEPSANTDVKTAVRVIIGATLVAAPLWAVTIFTSQFVSIISPPAVAVTWLALLIISVGATATVVVASLLTVALTLGSWHHRRQGGQPDRA